MQVINVRDEIEIADARGESVMPTATDVSSQLQQETPNEKRGGRDAPAAKGLCSVVHRCFSAFVWDRDQRHLFFPVNENCFSRFPIVAQTSLTG